MNLLKKFFKHPWAIIITCVALTGFFGFFITRLQMDNSLRQFFPQKDESYDRMNATEETFGSMLSIGVVIDAKDGTILTPEYLDVIRKISEQVKLIDNIEDVKSVTNIDYVCNQDGSISATNIIPEEDFNTPDGLLTQESIKNLKLRVQSWEDMYNRVILNDDFTGSQMQITVKPNGETKMQLTEAQNLLNEAKLSGDKEKIAEAKANLKTVKLAINTRITEAKVALKAAKKTHDAEAIEKAEEEYYNANSAKNDSARQQFVLKQVTKIVEKETAGKKLLVKIVGEPVQSKNSKEYMMSDLVGLIPLVAVVVIISLYLSFHTLEGTILPLVTVLMSASISVGLMGLLGYTFTLVSSVIPVALIAVGSAYGIHVLTHYYVEVEKLTGEITKEMHEEALLRGLKEVWTAVLLAGITTVVGFISLITSPLQPLHSFSIFTAIGVGISLILSVTFIPAILLLKDPKTISKKRDLKIIKRATKKVKAKLERLSNLRGNKSEDEANGDTLYSIFKFFCGSHTRLTLTSLLIIILSFAGLKLLKVDTALINYFPKDSDFRKDIDYVDNSFAGTNSVFFLVEGPEKGDISNPDILKAVDGMEEYLEKKFPEIGKIVSLTSFVKRINQVFNDPATYVPETPAENAETSAESFDMDFGDVDLGDMDFGDFGDFGETTSTDEFIDTSIPHPNEKYTQMLNGTYTANDVLDAFNRAYSEAGGKNASVDAIIDILLKDLNFAGKAYYEIPYDAEKYRVKTHEDLKKVINGLIILLSGSLDEFADGNTSSKSMRITCQLRNHNTTNTGYIIKAAEAYAKENFPEGYTLKATGPGEMEYTMTDMIVSSQLTSLLISLLSVFIIISISFKSGWAGVVGAIPLAFTILLNYMMMGFTGINLDLITSIIASVAVGVGIDYTIHFLSTYKEERSKSDDIVAVTKETFKKSGHGIVTNALAVGLGFVVLCLSKFVILRYLGVLVAIVMFTSSFLAMTIIPGILNLSDPKFIKPEEKDE
ncbi:efflux RND transporter permease subunit [Treponema sp.]|uniref:efflux RND transporter permease subunit n=1 Tax=Treponema sp. TaxID=166 RepID=UPI00298DF5A4|nr:MMPL family transporter [Treponema sp.]MCQ2240516.1 MMPL family transporter [Treponema sp.]